MPRTAPQAKKDAVDYLKCSDERGVLGDPDGVLKINDKLRLAPRHCDPTCNVHDWYVGVRNSKMETVWLMAYWLRRISPNWGP